MNNEYDWSLIICTYNAGDRLAACLENLTQMNGIDEAEVIVIDNDSSDGTIVNILSQDFCNRFKSFKIITEKKRGLSFARVRGYKEASGRFILYIDDDNFPGRDYIRFAAEIFSLNPKVGLIGGRSSLPEDWIIRSYYRPFLRGFAVGEQHEENGVLSGSAYLWGACLCVRKAAFADFLALFNEFILIDRKGTTVLSGGDGELVISLRMLGWLAYYSSELVFVHAISRDRFSIIYLIKLYKAFGLITPPFKVLLSAIAEKDKARKPFISRFRRKINDMKHVETCHIPVAVFIFVVLHLTYSYYKIRGMKALKSETAVLRDRVRLMRRMAGVRN